MRKQNQAKKVDFQEIFSRLTLFQRFIYLLLPIVFLAASIINIVMVYLMSSDTVHYRSVSQAEELQNAVYDYLSVADQTVDNLARNVTYMMDRGASDEEIYDYFAVQVEVVSDVIAEDTTGVYGYVNGKYVDSLWTPDDDYDPKSRPWYIDAVASGGEVTYVSPYLDMQTGEATVTVAKMLPDGSRGIR